MYHGPHVSQAMVIAPPKVSRTHFQLKYACVGHTLKKFHLVTQIFLVFVREKILSIWLEIKFRQPTK